MENEAITKAIAQPYEIGQSLRLENRIVKYDKLPMTNKKRNSSSKVIGDP